MFNNKEWNMYVKEVMAETGLSRRKAAASLKFARDSYGIEPKQYCKYKLYTVPVEQQEAVYNKKLQKKEEWNACIKKVMAETGLSHKEAAATLKAAREQYGIRAKQYCKYKMYTVAVEEQEAVYKIKKLQEEEKRKIKNSCIELIMQHKDCLKEEAKTILKNDCNKLKITPQKYLKYEVYAMPEERMEELYLLLVENNAANEKKEKDDIHFAEAEHAIEEIMKRKDWTREETLSNMKRAQEITKCSYWEYFKKEYFMFNMYNMTEEEQKNVALYYHSHAIAKKYMVDKNFARILKNKETTNIYFSDIMNRSWCINTKATLEEFKDCFKNCKRIIYKPIKGHKGEGVKVYNLTEDNIGDTYKEIVSAETGIVEEYVIQHPDLSAMAPGSVNTLRVVTVSSNDKPINEKGDYAEIIYTTLRIGSGTSIVDNFHGGGMCALADLETGELITDGANMNGEVFEKHPYTGLKIKGFQIPMYQEALKLVLKACSKQLTQGYIGWDIAITEKGPVLIEANMIPGIVLLSTPMGSNKQDSLSVIKPYLSGVEGFC